MNPLTLEWVDKAEGDYVTATREYRARISSNSVIQVNRQTGSKQERH
jgi:hypothetical protein